MSIYFDNCNILNKFQFGFKKGCGTKEAVVNVVNGICQGLDEGAVGVAGILYDLAKAFDLVDMSSLSLQKIYSFESKYGKRFFLNKLFFKVEHACLKCGQNKIDSI